MTTLPARVLDNPQQLAFVLKLHRDCSVVRGELSGRAEHLASGERHTFASLSELQSWIGQVLTRSVPQ